MPAIEAFMSSNVSTIETTQTLADAKQLMRDRRVRHLPVIEEGRVVGILSERELDLVTAIAERPPDELHVSLAMQADVLQVSRYDGLAGVARSMANRKCGSALVMDGEEVCGIFTTIDALVALAEATAI